eukprot:5901112-Pyramimonas_sp.AAC.1
MNEYVSHTRTQVTFDGEVFSWGCGENGQLGLATSLAPPELPKVIAGVPLLASLLAATGGGVRGPRAPPPDEKEPRRVEALEGEQVVQVGDR